MKVIIMVGVAGSGKSQYADELKSKSDSVLVISSDEHRLKMFGSLTVGNEKLNSRKVMKQVHLDFIESIKAREYETVILDTMNLTRSGRRKLYNKIKEVDDSVDVSITFFSLPLHDIIHQNRLRDGEKVVPMEKVVDMYLDLQVPKLEVDCDSFNVRGVKMFNPPIYSPETTVVEQMIQAGIGNMKSELSRLHEDHECEPYHYESIEEHIEMCTKNARAERDINLLKVAIFHDLGKSVAKKIIVKDGVSKGTYRGHANVSANYFLNHQMFTVKSFDKNDQTVLESIYQHMNSHQGMTDRNIRNNKLDKETLDMIEKFRVIDSISKLTIQEADK